MHLIDIPPHQSLLFVKIKQGRTGWKSNKFPVGKSTVALPEPIFFDYEFPSDPFTRHTKPLRLSFRFETSHHAGFTRYGIVELDLTQAILDCQFDLKKASLKLSRY
jgi:hypothetical protein